MSRQAATPKTKWRGLRCSGRWSRQPRDGLSTYATALCEGMLASAASVGGCLGQLIECAVRSALEALDINAAHHRCADSHLAVSSFTFPFTQHIQPVSVAAALLEYYSGSACVKLITPLTTEAAPRAFLTSCNSHPCRPSRYTTKKVQPTFRSCALLPPALSSIRPLLLLSHRAPIPVREQRKPPVAFRVTKRRN